MRGLRAQASLLLANGHTDALEYPVGMVWEEAELVVERKNAELANLAVVMQAAMMSGSGNFGKKSGEHFKKLVQSLTEE